MLEYEPYDPEPLWFQEKGFWKRYISYKKGTSLSCAQGRSCAVGLVVT
jgi:hypothetical protein